MSGKKQIAISGKSKTETMRILFIVFFFFALLTTYHLPLSFASSGASFLKMGVGARALGLGSAYTAIANDVTALHWNPAGLSKLTKKEISVMHAELFADSRFDFFGYAMPIAKGREQRAKSEEVRSVDPILSAQRSNLVLGIGAVYLSQGSMEGRSEDRTKGSDFSASDLAVTIGAGKLIGKYSVGSNLKLIQSKIADASSNGFAMDLGFMSRPLASSAGGTSLRFHPLQFGFAIQNIGPQMKFVDEGYNLPLTLSGGAGYQFFSSLLISADLKYQPFDSRMSFSFGTEFSPIPMLSLRAGYLISPEARNQMSEAGKSSIQNQISNLSGFGMGLGFKLGPSAIDYSFTPADELGNTQRVSLSLKF